MGNIILYKLKRVRVKAHVAKIMVLVMLVYLLMPISGVNILADEAAKVKTLEVTVDKEQGLVGEEFEYQIKYSYSSTDTTFTGEQIIASLPEGMVISGYDISDHVIDLDKDGDNTTNFVNGSTITFPIEELTGATGVLSFTAYYPIGSIDEDTVVDAIITGGDKDPTSDATIKRTDPTITVKLNDKNSSNWKISKSVASPYNGNFMPIPGASITYNIKLEGNTGNGAFNMADVKITDILPDEASYVSSTKNGVYDEGTRTITWDKGILKAGTSFNAQITVKYEEKIVTYEDGIVINEVGAVNVNDVVKNTATADGTTITGADSEGESSISDSASITFGSPDPEIKAIAKSARGEEADISNKAAEYSKSETIEYVISNVANNGNVPLDEIIVYDVFPDEIDIESVTTSAAAYYSLDVIDQNAAEPLYSQVTNWIRLIGTELNAEAKTATVMKFVYEGINVGQEIPDMTIAAKYVDGLTKDQTYKNTAYVTGLAMNYDGKGTNYDSRATVNKNDAYIKYVDSLPLVELNKSTTTSVVSDGERVTYKLTIKNKSNATGPVEAEDIVTIEDVLPLNADDEAVFNQLEIVGDANLKVSINDTSELETYTSATSTEYDSTIEIKKLFFNITGITLNQSESYTITYSVKVKEGTLVGDYKNTADATFTDDDEGSKIGPKTNPSDLTGEASVFVKFRGALNSIKGIGYNIYSNADHTAFLGDDGSTLVEDKDGKVLVPATDFTNLNSSEDSYALPKNFPIVNATLPGGVVRYQLEISNEDSNGPISNIVLIDRLPKLDDTGVVVTAGRNSSWSPYLASEIVVKLKNQEVGDDLSLLDHVKVFYSTVDEPSYQQLANPEAVNTGDHGDWSASLPTNITDVTHIKIQIDTELNPSDALIVQWDMKAPYDAPVGNASSHEIAWNSFAYNATYEGKNGTESFLASEAIKVGVRVEDDIESDVNGGLGNLIWHDENKNGIQDEGEIGINNIKVKLYYASTEGDLNTKISNNEVFDETYTGPNNAGDPGYYYFANLGAGFYKVVYEMPQDFTMTLANVEAAPSDDSKDSDFDLVEISSVSYYASQSVELSKNEINLSVDAGIHRKASLGDYIWEDYNINGLQDDYEPGVNGVFVTLYKADTVIATTRSITKDGQDGYYEFLDLEPGSDYKVEFDLNNTSDLVDLINPNLGNYKYTLANVGEDDSIDSDGQFIDVDNNRIIMTDDILIVSSIESDGNNNYLDLDASYLSNDSVDQGIHKAAIGDTVWNDQNVNGIQETGEPGLVGIIVKLLKKSETAPGVYEYEPVDNPYGDGYYEVTTDTHGKYLFTSLDPGDYIVDFDLPSGSTLRPTINTHTDDELNSDGDLTNYKTDTITIEAGQIDLTNDMGFYYPGVLGNFIWEDMNGNGIQDSYNHDHDDSTPDISELGISDVEVTLYTDNDKDGLFTDKYSYENHMTAYSSLPNAATTVDGLYKFDDLYFNSYELEVSKPAGFDGFTLQDVSGSTDANDSDANADGRMVGTTIGVGNYIDYTHDAGLYKYASLGDRVWIDSDMDGIQDTGEVGVNGVTVNLYKTSDLTSVYKTTTTQGTGIETGSYKFKDLVPGEYAIEFVDLPANYSVSPKDTANDNTVDSDAYPNAIQDNKATISHIELFSGENNMTYDLGIYPSFSIGNIVWEDHQLNGIQDTYDDDKNINTAQVPELGVNGVKLKLYTSTGVFVEEQLTRDIDGVAGSYKFEDLPMGEYYVKVVDSDIINIDQDYEMTTKDVGLDDTIDSDANPSNNKTASVEFTSDSTAALYDDTLDIGIYKFGEIGDYVWEDLNYDGIQNNGEEGIHNVIVHLYKDGSDLIYDTATTDENGYYAFEKLVPATYDLVFEIPDNYTATSSNQGDNDLTDSDGSTDAFVDSISRVEDIVIHSGDKDDSIDLGVYKSFSLGDYTWLDKNGNGLQDEVEVGLDGISLQLYKFNGDLQTIEDQYLVKVKNAADVLVDNIVTSNNGAYLFKDLPMGKYFVVVSTPSYSMTNIAVASDTSIDSNFEKATFKENHYKTKADDPYLFDKSTLAINRHNPDVDAGFFELAGLGDYVWDDMNYNGIQDDNEVGIQNVLVKLYKTGDAGFYRETKTDEAGKYFFDGLDPLEDTYTLKFEIPTGYYVTKTDQESENQTDNNDEVDSDGQLVGSEAVIVYEKLKSGDAIHHLDLGLYKKASLGNFVWNDLNRDGLQDVTGKNPEPGVAGVIVNLFEVGNENRIATDTTDSNGKYEFTDLLPGDYKLEFILPTGEVNYSISSADALNNTADSLDSDVIKNELIDTKGTAEVTLYSGDNNMTLDMGIYQSFALGNLVFEDSNGNGVQDKDEPGISGTTVRLFNFGDDPETDDALLTTETDENGNYIFEDLPLGTYFIQVVTNNGYVLTDANTGNDNEVDSDVNVITGISEDVVFKADSQVYNESLDVGMYELASLGDIVWLDVNRNGIQDDAIGTAELEGIANVTVKLYKEGVIPTADNEYEKMVTDSDGKYEFTDLKPGNYFVVFSDFPTDYAVSPLNVASDEAIDSDGDIKLDVLATSATTGLFKATSGGENMQIDLGLYPGFSLGDFAWYDINGNGLYDSAEDSTEMPIEGITMKLYSLTGETQDVSKDILLATHLTDSDGKYQFTGLPLGNYYVKIEFSNLYFLSNQNNGLDETIDSDFDVTAYVSDIHEFKADSDVDYPHIDAGLYKQAGLGDYVWIDSNYNGIQDEDESGLANVVVSLYKDGEFVKSEITAATGFYSFAGIMPGDYEIQIDIPESYELTQANQGNNDSGDSDGLTINATSASSGQVTLLAEETNPTIDFGLFQRASLGDKVFEDINKDGIQDDNEPGIENVIVNLYSKSDGANILTTITNEYGEYLFEDLYPNTYYVEFTQLPNGYSVTNHDQGVDDQLDSDATTTEVIDTKAITGDIVLVSGQADMSNDLGLYKNFSIGDYVWLDSNANGSQEAREKPIKGIELELYQVGQEPGINSPLETTITNSEGFYLFDDLPIGDYFVYVKNVDYYYISDINQSEDEIDSDFSPKSHESEVISFTKTTLDIDDYNDKVDLGLYLLAGLGDTVWLDDNYNGIQDDNESGLAGVKVYLYEGDTLIKSVTTNAYGFYAFTDIDPATYEIKIDIPATYYLTKANQGKSDAADSDGSLLGLTKAHVQNIILSADETNPTIDFGLYQLASLGDKVFDDTNKNGIQNNDEPGVENVTVKLYRTSDGQLLQTDITDANGNYLFNDLVPDNYYVEFSQFPSRYRVTISDQGGNDDEDSDADSSGKVKDIKITSGENVVNVDLGIYYKKESSSSTVPTVPTVPTLTPTPVPTVTPVPTPTPVPTVTPLPTVTPTPTITPIPSTTVTPPSIKEVKPIVQPEDEILDETTPKDRVFTIEGEVESVKVVKDPAHGSVIINEKNEIIYTPDDTFTGQDKIIIVVDDGIDEFIMEIDIFEEDIAQAQLAELPATSGVPIEWYYLFGSLALVMGIYFKKK